MRKQKKIFSSNKHIFDPFMRLFKTSAGRARLALKKRKRKNVSHKTEKFAKNED